MLVSQILKPSAKRFRECDADVHCLICSHRVPARVLVDRRTARVKQGEKCVRCGSNLESGCVLALRQAA
jgi:hypothetical protein